MKRAREWADEIFGCDLGKADIDHIRRIQADAIRFAANLSGDLATTYALKVADTLDRIAGGTFTQEDRDFENSL